MGERGSGVTIRQVEESYGRERGRQVEVSYGREEVEDHFCPQVFPLQALPLAFLNVCTNLMQTICRMNKLASALKVNCIKHVATHENN